MDRAFILGDDISGLRTTIKSEITSHFIADYRSWDISSLTEPKQTVNFLFFKNEEKRELTTIAENIAINLDRNLIVLHNNMLLPSPKVNNIVHINTHMSNLQARNQLIAIIDKYHHPYAQQDGQRLSKRFSIEDTLHFIDTRLHSTLNEALVAEHCHLSVNYFSKMFHAHIGVSFQDYVCNARIEQAKVALIQNRDQSIANVSYILGFKDVSYFSRLFKKRTGLTPGQYRKTGNQ